MTATDPTEGTGTTQEALEGLPASVPEALALRRDTPDHPFVVGPNFRLTFGEADARSAELAGRLLAAGVGKGTRVGAECSSVKSAVTKLDFPLPVIPVTRP